MSGRQHGTRAKYTQDKCRCDECRAANTDYQQYLKWLEEGNAPEEPQE